MLWLTRQLWHCSLAGELPQVAPQNHCHRLCIRKTRTKKDSTISDWLVYLLWVVFCYLLLFSGICWYLYVCLLCVVILLLFVDMRLLFFIMLCYCLLYVVLGMFLLFVVFNSCLICLFCIADACFLFLLSCFTTSSLVHYVLLFVHMFCYDVQDSRFSSTISNWLVYLLFPVIQEELQGGFL